MTLKKLKQKLSVFNECNILFLLLFFVSVISIFGQCVVSQGVFSEAVCNHVIRIVFCVFLMIAICTVEFKFWINFAYVIYAISLILLVLVNFAGTFRLGAQRWLNLGFFMFQPSEIMKLALILALARYYAMLSHNEIREIKNHITPLLFVVIPVLLIAKQPDLGTASVLFVVGIAIVFLSGFPAKIFGLTSLISISLCPLGWFFLRDYQKNRILTFINPDNDPLGTGYHILQSKIAIGSGGLFGKGFLNGTQSRLDFLPEKNTDFIFTTITEETGFVGGVIIILLLVAISFYCFWVGTSLKNNFSKLLCYGVGLMLFFHTFINIAMVMGLVPVVGIPLPFLSYGGSAMMTFIIGCALVISAAIYKK